MRIAIVNLTAGGFSGGYHKYLQNIIPRISQNPKVESLLIASSFMINRNKMYWNSENITTISCKQYRFINFSVDKDLIKELDKFSPNVVYVPTERYFRYEKVPIVNMIQNMEPFVRKIIKNNSIIESTKNYIKAFDGKKGIKSSSHIIAISKFVREYLINSCEISPNQIGLVYHGVNPIETKISSKPKDFPKNIKFLFTAGSIRPARGLEDLFQALVYLSKSGHGVPHVVIAGETITSMKAYKASLIKFLTDNKIKDKINWVGNLSENEMTWCFKNCVAFIMTSRVEACPFIALEALNNHCISISSDSPPMPEIFGEGAIYYRTGSGENLAEAIKYLHQNKRARLIKSSSEIIKKQLKKFSWDICATRTLNELQKALNH